MALLIEPLCLALRPPLPRGRRRKEEDMKKGGEGRGVPSPSLALPYLLNKKKEERRGKVKRSFLPP